MPLEQAGWREAVVALFGPVVSLVLAMGAIALQDTVLKSDVLTPFITANLTICAFNLLPTLPLDGGERAFESDADERRGGGAGDARVRMGVQRDRGGDTGLFVYSLTGARPVDGSAHRRLLFMGANQENANISGPFQGRDQQDGRLRAGPRGRDAPRCRKEGSSVGEVLRTLPHSPAPPGSS